MNYRKYFLILLAATIITSCNQIKNRSNDSVFAESSEADKDIKHVTQTLVAPPGLPEHTQVAEGDPVIVDIELVAEEKLIEIAPGVKTWALTFNGTVPGPIIVVHQNDYVQLTLKNPAYNTMMHNIDFHAATGAMGGGDLSEVGPGQEATFRFKATKTGVFVYHCAPGGLMVPFHVASGMNGAIMVLPREGLKDESGDAVEYDTAFYIGEQDFYIPKDEQGAYKEYGTPMQGYNDILKAMSALIPTHLVFNGKVDALTGANSLKVNKGQKVLFITSQANRDTRIHIVGGHADLVWPGGSFNDEPATNYETWPVPGGSAIAALYEFRQPGKYVYLNHNLIEAFMLGAHAIVDVQGEWNNNLMQEIE
jgi:nitrite reductase (NO-forming)